MTGDQSQLYLNAAPRQNMQLKGRAKKNRLGEESWEKTGENSPSEKKLGNNWRKRENCRS